MNTINKMNTKEMNTISTKEINIMNTMEINILTKTIEINHKMKTMKLRTFIMKTELRESYSQWGTRGLTLQVKCSVIKSLPMWLPSPTPTPSSTTPMSCFSS